MTSHDEPTTFCFHVGMFAARNLLPFDHLPIPSFCGLSSLQLYRNPIMPLPMIIH